VDLLLLMVGRPAPSLVVRGDRALLDRWLADRGLLVTHMEEPAPPPGFVALAPEYAGAGSIPRLLLLRAEKRQP
jgi:hypothetical protein